MFYHDSSTIRLDEPKQFTLIPEGTWLEFKIIDVVEKRTARGMDMLSLKCEVQDHSDYEGRWVYHNVVFIPAGQKGDGMSVHFRKCIGVPYGGNDLVDGLTWMGKRFMGKVGVSEYDGKTRNEIKVVASLAERDEPKTEDQIPF